MKPHSAILEDGKVIKKSLIDSHSFRQLSEISFCRQFWIILKILKKKMAHNPTEYVHPTNKVKKINASAPFQHKRAYKGAVAPTLGNTISSK